MRFFFFVFLITTFVEKNAWAGKILCSEFFHIANFQKNHSFKEGVPSHTEGKPSWQGIFSQQKYEILNGLFELYHYTGKFSVQESDAVKKRLSNFLKGEDRFLKVLSSTVLSHREPFQNYFFDLKRTDEEKIELANLYTQGLVGEKDLSKEDRFERAFQILSTLADKGNPKATFYLWHLYMQPGIQLSGSQKVDTLLQESARLGYHKAQFSIGVQKEYSKEFKEAFDHFAEASLQQYPPALVQLASFYLNRIRSPVQKDLEKAHDRLLRATKNGYPHAQYMMGSFFNQEKNKMDEAYFWYEKAGKQGHVVAQYALETIYYKEFQDYMNAFVWAALLSQNELAPRKIREASKERMEIYPLGRKREETLEKVEALKDQVDKGYYEWKEKLFFEDFNLGVAESQHDSFESKLQVYDQKIVRVR